MPGDAAPPARNLELKVRCDPARLAAARARLAAVGASPTAVRQVDAYFAVASGRLKLRRTAPLDGDGAPTAELIAYDRPDAAGARWSAYHRLPVAVADAAALEAALAGTVGVRAVVAKRREVAVVGRTRVHLDQVEGLGAFVELETVVESGDEGDTAAELARVAALVGLDPERDEVVAGSYGELVPTAAPRNGDEGES